MHLVFYLVLTYCSTSSNLNCTTQKVGPYETLNACYSDVNICTNIFLNENPGYKFENFNCESKPNKHED